MIDCITPDAAAALLRDGDMVLAGGNGGSGVPEAVFEAIERRFTAGDGPHDLTLFHVTGVGALTEKGMCHFAHPGLVRRVIGGNFGMQLPFMKMILAQDVEAYNFPQGVMTHLCRAMAGRQPGRAHARGPRNLHGPAPGRRPHERAHHRGAGRAGARGRPRLAVLPRARRAERGADPRHLGRRRRLREHGARSHRARRPLDGAGRAQRRRHRHLPGQAHRQARHAASAHGEDPGLPDRSLRGRARADADLHHALRPGALRRDRGAGLRASRQTRSTCAAWWQGARPSSCARATW